MNGKIISDYESLSNNDFWKLYIESLTEFADGRLTALESASPDQFLEIKGERKAMKLVLNKPKFLIDQIMKEGKNG